VNPSWSPTLGAVPCAALWYDTRAHGRPVWRQSMPAGQHDGWRSCIAASTELVVVESIPRPVCPDHARQARVVVAAGLAGRRRRRP
jgi:hypothetical protein